MIEALLTLSEVDGDVFEGQPRVGTILPKTFGGHTMAQALAAACRTVDDSRSPVSAQGFFLSAGDTDDPTQFTVERVRDGRSMDMRAVRAHQGHREIFRLTASFQTEETGFEHEAPMPVVAPPEGVPSFFDVMDRRSSLDSGPWRTEWSFLELRYVEENLIDPAPDHGRQQLWMRLPGAENGEPWRGRCLLTYVSDLVLLAASLVPHGVMLGAPDIPPCDAHPLRSLPRRAHSEGVGVHRSALGLGGRWTRAVVRHDVLARRAAAGQLRPGRADPAAATPRILNRCGAVAADWSQLHPS